MKPQEKNLTTENTEARRKIATDRHRLVLDTDEHRFYRFLKNKKYLCISVKICGKIKYFIIFSVNSVVKS